MCVLTLQDKASCFTNFSYSEPVPRKPVLIGNNPNSGTQLTLANAGYVQNLETIDRLRPIQILKPGILAYLYGSPDVAFYCIGKYDEQQGTDRLSQLMSLSSPR